MRWKKILAGVIAGVMAVSPLGTMHVSAAEHYTSETLNHGTVSVNALCDMENGVIELKKGESVTMRVSPYVHVQYKGCMTTPQCPDVCGDVTDCFIKGKGCKYDTTAMERTTELNVSSSVDGIVAIGEGQAEQEVGNTIGSMGDGVFAITALNEGTTTVTIDTYLRDWVSVPVEYTIHVEGIDEGQVADGDQEVRTLQAASLETWTTHSGFENGDAVQTLFVELTFPKAMEIVDKAALIEEMFADGNMSFGSGLKQEQTDVEIEEDGKTLKITTSGWGAQVAGIFEAKGIWKNLRSVDGEYAEPAARALVPNGIGTEIVEQVIGTESRKASVTTKIIRPADATRGQVHIVLLKNGQPVAGVSGSLDSYGGTETTHFHDYKGFTAESFTANFAPTSLTDTLEGMYEISYEEGSDQFTVTAVDSQPGDILEFHILSYLNNGTRNVDVSALEAGVARAETINGDAYTSESYAKLQDAAAKARLIARDVTYYAQTDVDYALEKLTEAEAALVKKETPTEPQTPAAPKNFNATVATNTKGVKATVSIDVKQRKASLRSVAKNQKTSISIPGTVRAKGKNYRVTTISAKAFSNAKKATTVILPKTITVIEKNAFSASKIKNIKLAKGTKGTGLTVRAKAFSGLKTKTMVIRVSKSTSRSELRKIKKAFSKAGFKGTIKTY